MILVLKTNLLLQFPHRSHKNQKKWITAQSCGLLVH